MVAIFGILGAYVALLTGLALYQAVRPPRCPNCCARGFQVVLRCRYSRRDVWGGRGGSYVVRSCPHCGLYRLAHRCGEEDLPSVHWREVARHIVFGESVADAFYEPADVKPRD